MLVTFSNNSEAILYKNLFVISATVVDLPAAGSNPKHTIYAFINLNLNLSCDLLKRWK